MIERWCKTKDGREVIKHYLVRNFSSNDCRILDDNNEAIETYRRDFIKEEMDVVYMPYMFIEGVPIFKIMFGRKPELPDREDDVYLIVDLDVALAARDQGRTLYDLYVPVQPVVDKYGMLMGYRGLIWAHDICDWQAVNYGQL